jgi:hypothetical protein
MHRETQRGALPVGLGVVAPLALLALAYGLWAISDRLVYIGPLDRAKFGWLVVFPVLASAPVAAGFAWRRLTQRGIAFAATLVGLSVAAASSALFWVSIAHPDCQIARMTQAETVGAALVVGLVVGGGYAVSGLLAAALIRREHRWWGTLLGAAAGFGMLWIAVFAAIAVLPVGGMCERPL